MKGTIFDIKEFGVHDGPGLVTTIFFKGCPLRCKWCHNPEGQIFYKELLVNTNRCTECGLCKKECNHEDCKPFNRCVHICPNNCVKICGKEYEASELADIVLKNRRVLDSVTFSGGEPLSQGEFLLEAIDKLNGIKINIETSGYCDEKLFAKVIDKVDLVYLDIKLIDDEEHIKYTGVSNKQILNNLNILKNSKTKVIIRTPLIPGITDTKENIEGIKNIIGDLDYELIPYNNLAGAKYKMLNREYELEKNS